MNAVVSEDMRESVEALLEALSYQRRDLTIDGVKVFEASDKFLPGKIAIATADLICSLPENDPRRAQYLADFREFSLLTISDPNETWGIYYYVSALKKLQDAGLLDQAVDAETLKTLKARLDWRVFVREDDLTLINLPNNYFGVAYSVARLRNLLGWEDASGSEALLAKTLDHYRRYSGEFGFADETDGQGRFDRYSVLLIGEIAQRLIETGVEPPVEVKAWLRRSVDVLLPRLNPDGQGFEYGRSIGVYGETAFIEVLSAAAALNILTPEEEAAAYAFSSRVAQRYVDFWLDPATGSVNLWDHGRKTDAYRGKHRILGENLSLWHQFSYTNAIWNRLGWQDRPVETDLATWAERYPKTITTWFARGQYDRLLVTYRDGGRTIGLPIINGAETQHMHNPYFPIPFSPGILAGAPDETYPQLIPQITLVDGSVLSPLAYIEDVDVQTRGDRTVVTWRQSALDRMGESAPRSDKRVTIRTRYELTPGRISRLDRIKAAEGVDIARVDTVFASFSDKATVSRSGARYGAGEVSAWTVTGMTCQPGVVDPQVHATPVGPLNSLVTCARENAPERLETGWTLTFRPEAR